jgi:hypothetical protein
MTRIATVGPLLPIAILRAADADAGILPWNVDRELPRAEQWLESKFPLWAKSMLEDWSTGAFDHLDAVLFSRADDAAQRLYYYTCELKRMGRISGPEPQIFDAALIGRASSRDRVVAEVRRLAQAMAVNDAALRTALAARPSTTARSYSGGPRCLMAGTPPPDGRLHDCIAAAGFDPHGATLADDWAEIPVADGDASADPVTVLADALRAGEGSSRSWHDAVDRLADRIAIVRPAAAVLWLAEEDESSVWHVPPMRRLLADRGVPALVLTRRDWRAADGVTAEIATFLKEIGR